MWTYNYSTSPELYHHGVKGMKWGVRKTMRSLGGSKFAKNAIQKSKYLDAKGKEKALGENKKLSNISDKRATKDAAKLNKSLHKTFDTYDNFRKSQSKSYVVDERGANAYGKDGKPIFDTTKGVIKYNKKKLDSANKYSRKLDALEATMKKKYDSVTFEGGFDASSGKANAKYILEKNGKKTVSEFSKDYGVFDMPYDFVTYKK